MDTKKEFDDLQSCLKNFNTIIASHLLSDKKFVTNNVSEIILLLGKELSNQNLNCRPDYYNFCEEQLLIIARSKDSEDIIFDFLELIDINECRLSSSVLVLVTVLEKIENPNRAVLEYLLDNMFKRLMKMNIKYLKPILLNIIQNLKKLNKHFHREISILYYFARVAFLVFRAKIDSNEYILYTNLLSDIIYNPFLLLEYEFEELEEYAYLASFFYLYFQTGMTWGPKIYNKFYILEKCSNLAFGAFSNDVFGKPLTKLVLTKYKSNEIPLYLLNNSHANLIEEAAYGCMYNKEISARKDSIESLMMYMDKLCTDAQYIVLKNSFSKPLDSCVKAQLIIKMKDLLVAKIRSNQNLGYFKEVRLLDMVRLCSNIDDGFRCHIIKNKEHVLAVITLVCVLYAYNDERLNMGELFINYLKEFVKTVQDAIDFTNEQYKLENEKLENKILDIKDDEENILNLPPQTEDEKRTLLALFNTSTTLVQSSLDMLKTKLKI